MNCVNFEHDEPTTHSDTFWMMPFAVSSSSYFTGYAIANPNELLAAQTDVQLEAVNADGTLQGETTVQLSPLNRTATLVPSGIRGGYFTLSIEFSCSCNGSRRNRGFATTRFCACHSAVAQTETKVSLFGRRISVGQYHFYGIAVFRPLDRSLCVSYARLRQWK